MAKIAGLVMVPSQFGPDKDICNRIIDDASQYSITEKKRIEKVQLNDKVRILNAIIYYPSGWESNDNSRCVVYHNPNAITAAEFFVNRELQYTARDILTFEQCPIVLYDYSGVGLNKEESSSST